MALVWQKLPEEGSLAPYDGQKVALAIVSIEISDDPLKGRPYLVTLGRWEPAQHHWATIESDHEGETVCLARAEPTYWAEINLPSVDDLDSS